MDPSRLVSSAAASSTHPKDQTDCHGGCQLWASEAWGPLAIPVRARPKSSVSLRGLPRCRVQPKKQAQSSREEGRRSPPPSPHPPRLPIVTLFLSPPPPSASAYPARPSWTILYGIVPSSRRAQVAHCTHYTIPTFPLAAPAGFMPACTLAPPVSPPPPLQPRLARAPGPIPRF